MATTERNARQFTASVATRKEVPLMIGLMGPSGGGKTMSALELATGIQSVVDGNIMYIDSESNRALHYADRYKFEHVPFEAPFSPYDYIAALDYCKSKQGKIIIVDSMSNEHEGVGGVLEWHERELDRIAGQDYAKRERSTFLAWGKPKAARRALIQNILQSGGIHFIFCFRAKEKIKLVAGQQPMQLGWMPIAGEEYVYEMTLNCLLGPNAKGCPTFRATEVGEKMMIKLPSQFEKLFPLDGNGVSKVPLSKGIGAALATWAKGGDATIPTQQPSSTAAQAATSNARNGSQSQDETAKDYGKLYIAAAKQRWPEDTKTCVNIWMQDHPELTTNKAKYEWLVDPGNALEDPFGDDEEAAGAAQSGELFEDYEIDSPKELVKAGAAAS